MIALNVQPIVQLKDSLIQNKKTRRSHTSQIKLFWTSMYDGFVESVVAKFSTGMWPLLHTVPWQKLTFVLSGNHLVQITHQMQQLQQQQQQYKN